ncbi:MAG: LLM class F420-dependent oxidoreductase [Thermomicrobiales bacterium]
MALAVSLMIEGQDGVNWPRWKRLAQAAEDLGFAGLYRSDHYTNPAGDLQDALELWTSLTWLASHTSRISFGPVVSPVSFRDPRVTAWTAAAIDDLSGGRLRLGLGAGWQEREHAMFGYDLLDTEDRFVRFTEGLEVVTRLLRNDGPVTFDGRFYQLQEAVLLPRPARAGGPPITIGGNGPKRTLPLAARFADEWNGVYIPAGRFAELSGSLDGMLAREGRAPGSLRRTLMNRVILADTESQLERKLKGAEVPALRERGVIVGGPDEVRERLAEFAVAGVEEIQLQWVDGLDDLDGIAELARAAIG